MDEEKLEEKIEEVIEKKVEERLDGKTESADKIEKIIDRKVRERISEDSSADAEDENLIEKEASRRSFLKMLGLGAGGLAFSSLGASFFSVNKNLDSGGGSSQNLQSVLFEGNKAGDYQIDMDGNDIVDAGTTVWDSSKSQIPSSIIQKTGLDADTVDGKEASELGGKKIVRDPQGNAVINNTDKFYDSRQITVTTTATSANSRVTLSEGSTYTTRGTIGSATGTFIEFNYGLGDAAGTPNTVSATFYLYKNGSTKIQTRKGDRFAAADQTNYVTTTTTPLSGDNVTAKAHLDYQDWEATIYVTATARSSKTGTRTFTTQLTTGRTPAFVSFTQSIPNNGNWTSAKGYLSNQKLYNGQLVGGITSSQDILLKEVKWSGVSTDVTWKGTLTVKEGTYTQ